jgi:hypothetical protein
MESIITVPPETEKLILPPNIELASFFERFWDRWAGCHHHWGFPFRSREMEYPNLYDTHQTCNKCGKSRFYLFHGKTIKIGPLFRVLIDNGKRNG